MSSSPLATHVPPDQVAILTGGDDGVSSEIAAKIPGLGTGRRRRMTAPKSGQSKMNVPVVKPRATRRHRASTTRDT